MPEITHSIKLAGDLQFSYTEGAQAAQVTHPDSEWGDRTLTLNLPEIRALGAFLNLAQQDLVAGDG
jgi:hypothetical protein